MTLNWMPLLALLVTSTAWADFPEGTLVIEGGDETQSIVDVFLNAAGGKSARVCLITTNTEEPETYEKQWKIYTDQVGAKLKRLDILRREQSSNEDVLQSVRNCTGYWFTGGDQNRTGDVIVGTPLHRLLLSRYNDGAAVGGTSAGAAIMSRIMLTGDDANGEAKMEKLGVGAYKTREGMGFLPEDCIVDQHFIRRARQNRLISVLMDKPKHWGFGIDEQAALVVKDGKATVAGKSRVLVFYPPRTRPSGNSFTDMQVHLLEPGQSIDLKTRKPITGVKKK